MTRRLMLLSLILGMFALSSVGCSHAQYTEIKPSDLPTAVKAGFDREYPGAAIRRVEKETYSDGVVHYGIEFTDRAGKQLEVELNDQGEVLEEEGQPTPSACSSGCGCCGK